ncbi:MAG: heme exporter protein CcmB [Parvibaculaceae bacterium]
MKGLGALVLRDLRLALRQGGGAGNALGFLLAVIVLVPLGIGPDQALLQRVAPGVLWIALLLSVLLSADRVFQADYEDGSLELLGMGPVLLELVVLAKAAAHWLTSGLPLAVLAPMLGFLLNLETAIVPQLLIAMLVGSIGLSLLAALGAAVTVGLRRGGLIVSLIILPLYVPLLIFGVAAGSGSAMAGSGSSALVVLAALTIGALVVTPFAAAAALRAYLK